MAAKPIKADKVDQVQEKRFLEEESDEISMLLEKTDLDDEFDDLGEMPRNTIGAR